MGSPADRLRKIDAVTDAALAQLEPARLLRELLDRVRELLAVDTAAAQFVDGPGGELDAMTAAGLGDEPTGGWHLPREPGGFVARIARTRQPVVVDLADQPGATAQFLRQRGLRVLLGVPMLIAGRLVGVLHVGSRADREFSPDDVKVLQVVADRMALAVHAQLSAAERAAATALQRSLLPSRLPVLPGVDFAARYVPGTRIGVSGDWYDVFALPSGALGVVIGDVAGHGLPAAVVMGRLRSALRAYALDSDDPVEVLTKLDRKATHFEAGSMTTVAYAVLAPDARTLRLSLAGHLPPVRARVGEPSELVTAPVDPPIGFGASRPRRRIELDLVPDSLLCFYTDGLVERPGVPIDASLDLLRTEVDCRDADELCTALVETFVDTDPADDIAVLVMRHLPG